MIIYSASTNITLLLFYNKLKWEHKFEYYIYTKGLYNIQKRIHILQRFIPYQ